MIIIQTTIGSEEDARELTNYLVNKQLIACGITSYSNKEINKIKGKQSKDIIDNLGYIHTEEIIHKNNLVNL